METKAKINITANELTEWFQESPFYVVDAFRSWYLKYHDTTNFDFQTKPESHRRKVKQTLNALHDIFMEKLDAIKVEATDEQPPREE